MNPFIDNYIERARSALPEGFDTDGFLEELRTRIVDSLDAKIQEDPTENPKIILFEVLEELGPPERIKKQSLEPTTSTPPVERNDRSPELTLAIRGIVSGAIVIIAAIIL